ncbi:MAG: hypothetical protein ABW125_18895 [Candidatus Thiodiazotropha lotti]
MKKIDLHIHTLSTVSDGDFEFSVDTIRRYVSEADLDAIAVTNHNTFDSSQFIQIQQEVDCVVFPGIEVDLQSGHLLVISNGVDLEEFESKCKKVSAEIVTDTDSISTGKLVEIFGDLSPFLLIPHYRKSPPITGSEYADLMSYFSAGEVDSAKKFVREMKRGDGLCPVLFSDSRMATDMTKLPTRQTYIDCGDISLSAIKATLQDKSKVFLSKSDGNELFQVFENGQHMSTGLNVVYGDRSSGKTVTLNRMSESLGKVKYIKQFELVQSSDEEDKKKFNAEVQKRRNSFVDEYLSSFRVLVDDISKVEIDVDEKNVEKYIETLLKSADDVDREDSYSKVILYKETEYAIGSNKGLKQLIASVINLIENVDYRSVVELHLSLDSLRSLAVDLIKRLWVKSDQDRNHKYVNSMIKDVKDRLQVHTAATRIETADLYGYAINKIKIKRFNEIVAALQSPMTIFNEPVQGFRVVAQKGPYKQASELNDAIRGQAPFRDALSSYGNPYEYLNKVKRIDNVQESEIYRLFAKITYRILNESGADVSGGERSEFRLVHAIKDAQMFDALLIDEPESSFDNKFLNRKVNDIIKSISSEMPVVVVTHNNSVGASIHPDYLIYAEKKRENGSDIYRLYSGHPADKKLKCIDGGEVNTYDIFLNALEAGADAYNHRREIYETVKD